tara:strand:+ start:181 stop:321 length:141 start_codon:yes stop_codon:yes gene_type:complete
MNDLKLVPTEKEDHYRLFANGSDVFGENEMSFYKHLIQTIDNGIFQ